jgi:hypothetical protein
MPALDKENSEQNFVYWSSWKLCVMLCVSISR